MLHNTSSKCDEGKSLSEFCTAPLVLLRTIGIASSHDPINLNPNGCNRHAQLTCEVTGTRNKLCDAQKAVNAASHTRMHTPPSYTATPYLPVLLCCVQALQADHQGAA